ncbi:hypothetical protein RRF57_001686 [Xylaria bambusicola]|uniref:Uncharacterized protein n=1 Tax=Xylaria bambusicola TaxID=326684 RepID=A0AAN7YV35_9PEZI
MTGRRLSSSRQHCSACVLSRQEQARTDKDRHGQTWADMSGHGPLDTLQPFTATRLPRTLLFWGDYDNGQAASWFEEPRCANRGGNLLPRTAAIE